MGFNRFRCALFSVCLAAPAHALSQNEAIYPSFAAHSVSPDRRVRVSLVRYGDQVSGPAYAFKLHRRIGPSILLLKFDRSAGVLWAPDSGAIAINDYAGSDNSDCIIFSDLSRLDRTSLSEVISRQKLPRRANESFNEAHYYVRCLKWQSPSVVEGTLSGHTDAAPQREFKYEFVFDKKTQRIMRWTRKK